MVIWLRGAPSRIGLEDGVLRAADVEAMLSLDAMREALQQEHQVLMEAARDEAQAIVATARTEAKAIEDGMRAKVEAAIQAGFDQGRERNAQEWHQLQVQQALTRSQAMRQMHEKLATIVTSAVERIVHTEQREGLYQRALRNVQTLTRGATQLTLRVGPADLDAAQHGVAEAREFAPEGIHLEVSVDASLKPGSCVFESELGILDASLETQLDALRAAMRRAVHKALADSPDDDSLVPSVLQTDEAEETDEVEPAEQSADESVAP
jgi:type III secretion protein L